MKSELVINSLGEIIKDDEDIIGSICITPIADRVLSDKEHKIWSTFDGSPAQVMATAKVDRAVKAEFRRLEREALDAADLKVVRTVHRLQAVNDDRYRVYGGIEKGKVWINLVTEFKALLEEKSKWDSINNFVELSGGKMEIMFDAEHMDHGGTKVKESIDPESRPDKSNYPDSEGYYWSFGKDHGKKERQVEITWDVRGMSVPQVRKLMKHLDSLSDGFWYECGISVI